MLCGAIKIQTSSSGGSEIKPIPYFSTVDRRVRRYFPDFWLLIQTKEGEQKRLIIEIKPRCQIERPKSKKRSTWLNEMIEWTKNQDKWKAATEWAKQMGFEFTVMDERSLGITK